MAMIRHFITNWYNGKKNSTKTATQKVAALDYDLLQTVRYRRNLGLTILYEIGDSTASPRQNIFSLYCRLIKGTVAISCKIKWALPAPNSATLSGWAFVEAASCQARTNYLIGPRSNDWSAR